MIIKVIVFDSDQENNVEVYYVIELNFRSKFEVDFSIGIIRVKVEFDREQESFIIFKVYVVDNGILVLLIVIVIVKFNIEDDNDEFLMFNKSSYNF